jgi:transcriptional regulator GlxA family with amidase domain
MRKNQAMTQADGTVQHRIAVLALDNVVAFDLGVPAQVFGAARSAAGRRLYRITTCTPDGGPIRTTAGFQVVPDHDLSVIADADTVIVPGIHDGPPLTDGTVAPSVAAALVAAHDRGARVMSICTGASVLAAAGLLDGRPATTHWRYTDRFRRLYPDVKLDPDVLFVDDGTVLTSAGVGAGIDLCLHVIRRDHGSEVANRAARRCVVPPWRDGGQAQYIERPLPRTMAATTADTRGWALSRLQDPLTLRALAAHASMSVRTFTRRFRAETGVSPTRWLREQRIDRARLLLETTHLSVDQVARQAGFGTATSLRQHLNAAIGVAPIAYRRTFAGVPDSGTGDWRRIISHAR